MNTDYRAAHLANAVHDLWDAGVSVEVVDAGRPGERKLALRTTSKAAASKPQLSVDFWASHILRAAYSMSSATSAGDGGSWVRFGRPGVRAANADVEATRACEGDAPEPSPSL